jgi:SAM-dependent methyltransferase
MTLQSISVQAIEHVPGLLLILLTLYAAYWIPGIARWPLRSRSDALLDAFGTIEFHALGGFRMRALALISLASLFLELLLIRWVASEIRIFAYFKSLVLIACFLGFGLGCYLTRRRIHLAYTLVPLLAMAFLIELPWAPVRHLIANLSGFIGWLSDVHIWGRAYFVGNSLWGLAAALLAMSVLVSLCGLIGITFVPLGQMVGWYLENSRNGILGYSVNVFASIVGIWLYTLLCFAATPPVVWFAFFGVVLAAFVWPLPAARRAVLASLLATLALFGVGTGKARWWGEESWKGSTKAIYGLTPGKAETYWSPYQKLTIVPLKKDGETVKYVLNTNDSWYQEVMDLSPAAVARHPELYEGAPVKYHHYNLPYRFYPNPPEVLIAGAGNGNDAAGALRNGAEHVTAVEIDPLIAEHGKALHPEHPYNSSRVEVHVNDARNFVQNTKRKYDLVVFSILDSHTTSSYYTNIRLDNYVYTQESLERARTLLKPDGLFVMSFSSERPWFAGRLRELVTRAFGKPPLTIHNGPQFFVVGNGGRVGRALAGDPDLRKFVETHPGMETEPASLTTDDWPYLYQQARGIPVIVWVLSLGMTAVCLVTFRRLKQSSEGVQWHFFFLGAAFMLLEVQIISKAALLFGTTWLVNSIVITGLLLFILLANFVASRYRESPGTWPYWGLFLTLAAGYLIPTNSLFSDSALLRGAMAAALYCSPVFFAGLIFISSFKRIGFRAEAFGSNLLGSLAGGLLESLSYLTGIQALVIIAALLYFLSLATISRERLPELAAVRPATAN